MSQPGTLTWFARHEFGLAWRDWLSLLTAPQLIAASLIFEPGAATALVEAGWAGYGAVLYMTFMVTIIGYGLWYFLIPRYDVNQTMPFTLLVPIFGVIGGLVFLDEPFSWRVVIGGAATLVGVGIIIVRRPRMIAPEAQAER